MLMEYSLLMRNNLKRLSLNILKIIHDKKNRIRLSKFINGG